MGNFDPLIDDRAVVKLPALCRVSRVLRDDDPASRWFRCTHDAPPFMSSEAQNLDHAKDSGLI